MSIHTTPDPPLNVNFVLVHLGVTRDMCMKDNRTGQRVGVKVIVFSASMLDIKRTYRELKILRHFCHGNVVSILDIVLSQDDPTQHVYIVLDIMESDLGWLIHYSDLPISMDHIQYFLYQILCGLYYIHSANVVHFELTPSNLLINDKCDLKIGGFGMAKGSSSFFNKVLYLYTRWYRAPEFLMSLSECITFSVDMWSVGVIVAEMITRKHMFPGGDSINQLLLIFNILGIPSSEYIEIVDSQANDPSVKRYLQSLPKQDRLELSTVFPQASEVMVDLLDKLFQIEPKKRISAKDALAHKYLTEYHNPSEEPVCSQLFDFDFERKLVTKEALKQAIVSEITDYSKNKLPTSSHVDFEAMAEHSGREKVSAKDEGGSLETKEDCGTPLCEEELDALHRLLPKSIVSLPSWKLTFEGVQLLLLETGLVELATNLRARLDKVIADQRQHLTRLENLMTDKDTVELRYLKTFLVGPPGVGKTTTLNRLLKIIVNICSSGDKGNPLSTLFANCIQVFAFISDDGTEWISSASDLNQETVLLFRYLCGCKLEELQPAQSNKTQSYEKSSSIPMHPEKKHKKLTSYVSESDLTVEHMEITSDYSVSHIRRSRINNFISRLYKVIVSEDHSTLLNLLGSTLLNINDIGGQPGFLEMLPALSTGPAMYLVFFDLSKELDKPYKIAFNREDTVITPYDAMYTVEAIISQILSAIASVHCISHEGSRSLLNFAKAGKFGERFKCFQQVQPMAAFIGTHKDYLKENTEQKLENIDIALKNITQRFSKITVHPDAHQCFFAVDNLTGTDEYDVGPIRDFMSTIFQSEFKDASLPICPKWLWLSLILRREFRIVPIEDCLEITESFGMDTDEFNFALWYLHFCTGTLMYYPEVPDKWFKNHIICSPQVVFDSISELIVASLRTLQSKGPFNEYERKEMIHKGQFSLESIEKYCSRYQVKKNLEKFELIPPKQLVELLNYVNLLSPIVHNEGGSERIMYFMPAVLDCASPEELTRAHPPDANSPQPLFITFSCGFVPTGTFCGLITRLVSLGPGKILGLTWELVEEGVKRNHVSFTVDDAHRVTLLCHNRSYEIRVIRGDSLISLHDLCTHALSVILYMLSTLYKNLVTQVAFQCPCSVICSGENVGHLCVLSHKLHVRFICENSKKCVALQPPEWLGKCVHPGSFAELVALNFAENDFSFHWTKEGSRQQITTTSKPNVLTFPSISEEDLGYYLCEVRDAGRVVFTVYRALYRGGIKGGKRPQSSQDLEFGAKRPRQRSLSDLLTPNDYHEVYETLVRASVQWCELGGALGLDIDTLSTINCDHQHDVQTCLREMLTKRLQSGGPLSWKVLCDCLKSPTVKRNDLATEIEQKIGISSGV